MVINDGAGCGMRRWLTCRTLAGVRGKQVLNLYRLELVSLALSSSAPYRRVALATRYAPRFVG